MATTKTTTKTTTKGRTKKSTSADQNLLACFIGKAQLATMTAALRGECPSTAASAEYDQCMVSCGGSHSECQARCRRYLPPARQVEKRRRGKWRRYVAVAVAVAAIDLDTDGDDVLGDDMTARRR